MTTPYRDDFDAAQEKLAELEQELRAVKTRADELSKLKRDEASLAREVAALTSRLEGMAKKRALPLLDNVRIASPCKADWDEMIGDARVRFCASCQKDVYNLSEMARQEAESFLREKAGNACVRLYRRADGTVLTADCPVGLGRLGPFFMVPDQIAHDLVVFILRLFGFTPIGIVKSLRPFPLTRLIMGDSLELATRVKQLDISL